MHEFFSETLAIVIKQLQVSLFGSYIIEQYTGLDCILSDNEDKMAP